MIQKENKNITQYYLWNKKYIDIFGFSPLFSLSLSLS